MGPLNKSLLVFFLTLLFFITPAVKANDGTATLAAGGIQLTPNDRVSIESEELFISPHVVKVRYRFHNETDKDFETLVAFPLPEIDTYAFMWQDALVNRSQPDNFIDFQADMDGVPIKFQTEMTAKVADQDVTERLKKYNIPLSPFDESLLNRLKAVDPQVQSDFIMDGIVEKNGEELYPKWRLHTTFYWKQLFPANSKVYIRHQYKPVVGHFLFNRQFFIDEPQAFPCMKSSVRQGTLRMFMLYSDDNYGELLEGERIEYVLKTGAGWRGPIKRFGLTIDKGQPYHILSTCIPGLRKISPTLFRAEYQDFTPYEDLNLLIVTPLSKE